MNIAVYLGANFGENPIYKEAVVELGQKIAEEGHTLVYGGSKSGLMGVLGETVLKAGGDVIGVEPQFFIDEVLQLEGDYELIVTETMQERRAIMMEKADVFIAFPGGTGTMEEISEVICAGNLKHHEKLFGYYNVNGFYDPLIEQYTRMVHEGFVTPENAGMIHFWRDVDEIFMEIDGITGEE